MLSAQLKIAGINPRIRSSVNPGICLLDTSPKLSFGSAVSLRRSCGWIRANSNDSGTFDIEEEEIGSSFGDSKLDLFEEEELTEEWFEVRSTARVT